LVAIARLHTDLWKGDRPTIQFLQHKPRRKTMSDIRLDDNNNVILEGNVGIGTNNPIRSLHVEGSEIHSGGASSGFSFDDRKKGNGERWVWYAENGEARLFSQKTGQTALSVVPTDSNGLPRMLVLAINSMQITTESIQGVVPLTGGSPAVHISGNVHIPNNVGIGTNNPIRKLHVEGSEIHSGGAGSGFSFDDRKKGNGERWVWYADDGVANLFSQKTGQNALSILSTGNVGIGTKNPTNKLHIVGNGPVTIENPNGEADILFKSGSNPSWQVGTNNEGWYVWDNAYRFVVKPGGSVEVKGKLFVDDDLFVNGTIRGTIRVDGKLLGRDIGPNKKTNAVQFEANAIQLAPNASDSSPHFALYHELSSSLGKDLLIVNYEGGYKQGIKLEGNVQTTGALAQASSIALKENVAELSGQEAMAALQGLNAVKYNYKADSLKEQHIGFIAEDVPDLVASSERDRLSPMDIIAVLTKAMQEQQRKISEMAEELNTLKRQSRK
jgi:Chaperone of endosialidase